MANEKLTPNHVPRGHRPPPPSPIGRSEPRLQPRRVPRKRINVYAVLEHSPHPVNR
jgi:hypothetical protein